MRGWKRLPKKKGSNGVSEYLKQVKKGDLASIQQELVRRGELVHDSATRTPSESRFGQAFVDAGIPVFTGFMIGKYQYDFKIKNYSILVEVDGGVHRTPAKQHSDAYKDRLAAVRGFTVLRFMNTERPEYAVDTVRKVVASRKKQPREVFVVSETFWEWVRRKVLRR